MKLKAKRGIGSSTVLRSLVRCYLALVTYALLTIVPGSSPLNASTESATTITNYAGPGPAAGSGAHRSVQFPR